VLETDVLAHFVSYAESLAVTRDLKNWERPFRVPCVPRGRKASGMKAVRKGLVEGRL
jgi:hypothetical protein